MKLFFSEHEQKIAYLILIPSSEKKYLLYWHMMGTLLVQTQSKLSAFTGFALEQGSQTVVCVPLIVHKPFKSGSWPAKQELPPPVLFYCCW